MKLISITTILFVCSSTLVACSVSDNEPLLIKASWIGDATTVKLLLDKGAKVDVADEHGELFRFKPTTDYALK